jgi:small-conductance mechanosensitive channel
MMKLPLRLTYDTDVEKVRKLIKKLGQQLLEDPVIGPLFMQPLKSQGVYAMEDSAMIIRVKYMTRPGDQFVTRKVIYAAIREIFQREGVHFAHREVTVRLADGVQAENLTPEQREAVAGSVRSVIDEEEAKRLALPNASKAAASAL